MSATKEDTAGSETDRDGSKKGRFVVKFAAGRRQSEDPEVATPTDIQELPSPHGK